MTKSNQQQVFQCPAQITLSGEVAMMLKRFCGETLQAQFNGAYVQRCIGELELALRNGAVAELQATGNGANEDSTVLQQAKKLADAIAAGDTN